MNCGKRKKSEKKPGEKNIYKNLVRLVFPDGLPSIDDWLEHVMEIIESNTGIPPQPKVDEGLTLKPVEKSAQETTKPEEKNALK